MSKVIRNRSIHKGTALRLTAGLLITAIIVTGGVMVLRRQVRQRFATSDQAEVKTAQVTRGSISTTVSSSGTLANLESEDTGIPGEVEMNEIYVEAGQTVEAGDMLASVVSAMKSVQAQIDAVDKKLDALEDVDEETEIKSAVSGRVKKICAEAGDSVKNVMVKHEALMLLSLDGKLSVEVETDKLSAGDSVTVTASDGTGYEGSVESVWSGTATVLLTDNGPKYGDKVTVSADGKKIGTGRLSIHEELAVTGHSGTVKAVKVEENQKVSSGKVQLTRRANHYPTELSGGQQQRVAIARAIVTRPSLILADEPTGNLDSKTTAEIMALFHELHRQGNTIVMITHDDTVAAQAAQQITIRDGRLTEVGA